MSALYELRAIGGGSPSHSARCYQWSDGRPALDRSERDAADRQQVAAPVARSKLADVLLGPGAYGGGSARTAGALARPAGEPLAADGETSGAGDDDDDDDDGDGDVSSVESGQSASLMAVTAVTTVTTVTSQRLPLADWSCWNW